MNGMPYNERRLLWAILAAGALASSTDDEEEEEGGGDTIALVAEGAANLADEVLEQMLEREYLFDPALVDVKEDET